MTVKKLHDAISVMIVDDSEDDVEAARRAFRQAGADAPLQHLFSGEDALQALGPGGSPLPDLILLDLNMPGIGGRKTLETIKRDGRLKHIPVIVLTTSSYEEDVRACYILGANSFVTKPVNFESFAQAIRLVKEYWFDTALLPRAHANDGTA